MPPRRTFPCTGPPGRQPCSGRDPGRSRAAGARDVQGRGASGSGGSNGRTRAARRRRSREPRRDPSGPDSRLVRAGLDRRDFRPRSTTGRSSQRSGPAEECAAPRTPPRSARSQVQQSRRLSLAEDVPLWVYVLLAFAIALLGAAAALPKSETAGLSASLLLGLVGATILLGLTLHVRARPGLRAAKGDRRGLR